MTEDLEEQNYSSLASGKRYPNVSWSSDLSFITQTSILDEVFALWVEALDAKASSIALSQNNANQAEALFLGHSKSTPIKTIKLNHSLESIGKLIQTRSFLWPEVLNNWTEPASGLKTIPISIQNDGRGKSTSPPTLALAFFPFGPYNLLAQVKFTFSANRQITGISLNNLDFTNKSSELGGLDLSSELLQQLRVALSNSTGIVLTNRATEKGKLAGTSILSSLRPDAVVVSSAVDWGDMAKLLDCALDYFIIVEMPSIHPLELIDRFLSLSRTDTALKQLLLEKIIFSFCYISLPRNCPSCSKSTIVPTSIRSSFPPEVQAHLSNSFTTTIGCPSCQHTGLNGTTGLSSAVCLTPDLRYLYSNNATPEKIAEYTWQQGTVPLMLDGIRRISSGKLTFSELKKVVPEPPYAYLTSITQPRIHTASRPHYSPISSETELNTTPSSAHLLVVEDDPQQREVFRIVLGEMGYKLSIVNDAMSALSLLEHTAVDMVLSDFEMPGMSGAELASKLSQDSRFSHLPIIVLSANEDPEIEFQALHATVHDFCSKDVSRKVLKKRIERCLATRKTQLENKPNNTPAKRNPLAHLLKD